MSWNDKVNLQFDFGVSLWLIAEVQIDDTPIDIIIIMLFSFILYL